MSTRQNKFNKARRVLQMCCLLLCCGCAATPHQQVRTETSRILDMGRPRVCIEAPTGKHPAPPPDELKLGYGTFEGTLAVTIMTIEGGRKVLHPFSTFHPVSGTVTWKSLDGSIHSFIAEEATTFGSHPERIRLSNRGIEDKRPSEMTREDELAYKGVVLLDLNLHEKRAFYLGRVQEVN